MMGVKDIPTPNFGAATLFRNAAEALPSPLDAWRRRLAASAKEPEALVYGCSPSPRARHATFLRSEATAFPRRRRRRTTWPTSTGRRSRRPPRPSSSGCCRSWRRTARRAPSVWRSRCCGASSRPTLGGRAVARRQFARAAAAAKVVAVARTPRPSRAGGAAGAPRLAAEWSGADAMAARRGAALGLCAELWTARPRRARRSAASCRSRCGRCARRRESPARGATWSIPRRRRAVRAHRRCSRRRRRRPTWSRACRPTTRGGCASCSRASRAPTASRRATPSTTRSPAIRAPRRRRRGGAATGGGAARTTCCAGWCASTRQTWRKLGLVQRWGSPPPS